MDEVDKIIVHSLNQIGCQIDDNCTMAEFTPSILVHAVSKCLYKIEPLSTNIPKALPEGLAMAQRFSVATALSTIISNLNYRGDIGYQTFLYPNAVDVRKLLMFLIEKLPRDEMTSTGGDSGLLGDLEIWRRNVKETILHQLHKPWVPPYCRNGRTGQTTTFKPHHNLNFFVELSIPDQGAHLVQHKTRNIFQKTSAEEFDLISSILHQNSFDLYAGNENFNREQIKLSTKEIADYQTSDVCKSERYVSTDMVDSSPLIKLTDEVNKFKVQNVELLLKRKTLITDINSMKNQQGAVQKELENVCAKLKLHERTCLVLDNPKENTGKLETLIRSTVERRKNLDHQWHDYRQPMLDTLERLRSSKQLNYSRNLKKNREIITQLQQNLEQRNAQHNELSTELRASKNDRAAPRKEYIQRILEFISNIRKQRSDIYKVLDDTRDLQKQLNSISAQLQRQFCYTDDLLFQTAKHDMHSKQAYKLLASLHTTCNELVDIVAKTGNVTNTIREIEVQIDREKIKNVRASLQQITADIQNFENIIHNIQTDIRGIENEISNA
ncbi:LOW QUALITY PROTEIN: coiled-coil domain-containing protein 22 homolog [Rhagoletis pomonella]|uniref:LOW QUALITY PROTEIN: coiled-coil domain-containing protein 22 homolog n=1 Tax=Rhagoletis pomonella TaxID=28610 RepID=UPI0017827D06|nr:LOW QUALITY PROTEIN: coiled-coil domain-containing protein 22 homolog [Rhagoletis pomonella]